MTASNHVVTGALIAAVTPVAAIAIPAAFLSHFVLDALPHYGDNNKHSWLNRKFKYVLGIDITLSLIFLIGLAIAQPTHWVLYIICGIIATSPDLLWAPYFLADLRHQEVQHSRVAKFLKWIQWGERPWGIYIEAVTLVTVLVVFLQTIY